MAKRLDVLLDGFTVEFVNACFSYEPKSGSLTWKVASGGKAKARVGDPAGSACPRGYLRICVFGRFLYAHSVAWAISNGAWPSGRLDHANGVRSDNRIANLRLATPLENSWNRRAQSNNKTGFKGVSLHKRTAKYRARIKDPQYGERHLGLFETAKEAALAYDLAAKQIQGRFARLNLEN